MKIYKSENVTKMYNQEKLKTARIINFILDRIPKKSPGPFEGIKSHSKILVIQSNAIGDLIMATPMFRALKNAYPDSQITLLANKFAIDIVNNSPFISDTVTIEFPWGTYNYHIRNLLKVIKTAIYLRKKKFDLAIDAHIDMRNAFLMYLIGAKRRLAYDITGGGYFLTDIPKLSVDKTNILDRRLSVLEYLGIDCSNKRTELFISLTEQQWAESFLSEYKIGKGRVVGIHPGASSKDRQWNINKISEIIKYIDIKGFKVILFGVNKEEKYIDTIIRLSSVAVIKRIGSLREFISLASYLRFMICMDSAASHIAASLNIPAIVLYGPNPPEHAKPFSDKIIPIYLNNIDCRNECRFAKCKNNICMTSISTEMVFTQIEKIIEGNIKLPL